MDERNCCARRVEKKTRSCEKVALMANKQGNNSTTVKSMIENETRVLFYIYTPICLGPRFYDLFIDSRQNYIRFAYCTYDH